jgi:hydrogenase nickel incorporation protein HypA/HybF
MHELSVANSILETVRGEAERRPDVRIAKVGMRLGEWAGVDAEALGFCFDSLVAGSSLAPLALEIERRPRRQRCPRCERTFTVADYSTACPLCGSAETDCVGGDELELAYLEVEEP